MTTKDHRAFRIWSDKSLLCKKVILGLSSLLVISNIVYLGKIHYSADLEEQALAKDAPFEKFDIEFYYAPNLMKKLGAKLGAALNMTDGSTKVVVDNYFINLSEEGKKFILFHEKGHQDLKHLVTLSKYFERVFNPLRKKVSKSELEADSYAAEILGQAAAISGLKNIEELLAKNFFNKIIHILSIKEINLRIHNLQKIVDN